MNDAQQAIQDSMDLRDEGHCERDDS